MLFEVWYIEDNVLKSKIFDCKYKILLEILPENTKSIYKFRTIFIQTNDVIEKIYRKNKNIYIAK